MPDRQSGSTPRGRVAGPRTMPSVTRSRYAKGQVVAETGADMKVKYKETARGGLAVNVIEC
ncbi:hypothetical protein GTZ78_15915 [Streptomyces sp. SID8361]|nr:hypothetical protein [Streptomyces sp. SID8361]SCF88473.1 hypothetical protein GA0115260_1036725 [Streptomyces sp. MnatMP-M27]